MNLHHLLRQREAAGKPVRVGLIGAGKFGTMFLAQALRTPGLHLMAVADLSPERARAALARTGWPAERIAAADLAAALRTGATHVGDDAEALIRAPGMEVVIDATGVPKAGLRHALLAIAEGRHIVMVNVEARCAGRAAFGAARRRRRHRLQHGLRRPAGPDRRAGRLGARLRLRRSIAAGKGTKYLPSYHASTPETVWGHYGLTPEQARPGGMNPQMFNSFLDGTKSAIEMAAVANATGLAPPADGLAFPPCGVDDLARVLRPRVGRRPTRTRPARSRSSRRSSATGGRCSAICAGASMSCSRRRPTTSRAASPSTAS